MRGHVFIVGMGVFKCPNGIAAGAHRSTLRVVRGGVGINCVRPQNDYKTPFRPWITKFFLLNYVASTGMSTLPFSSSFCHTAYSVVPYGT